MSWNPFKPKCHPKYQFTCVNCYRITDSLYSTIRDDIVLSHCVCEFKLCVNIKVRKIYKKYNA